MKVKLKLLSRVRLFVIPWTTASQAPPSMWFSRQEYWSGLPFPSPGDLPNSGIEPGSPALQADALPSKPLGKPKIQYTTILNCRHYSLYFTNKKIAKYLHRIGDWASISTHPMIFSFLNKSCDSVPVKKHFWSLLFFFLLYKMSRVFVFYCCWTYEFCLVWQTTWLSEGSWEERFILDYLGGPYIQS